MAFSFLGMLLPLLDVPFRLLLWSAAGSCFIRYVWVVCWSGFLLLPVYLPADAPVLQQPRLFSFCGLPAGKPVAGFRIHPGRFAAGLPVLEQAAWHLAPC